MWVFLKKADRCSWLARRGNMAAAGDCRGRYLTSYQNTHHHWECLGCDLFWQKYFQRAATLQLTLACVLSAWQCFLNLEWFSGSFYLRASFSMLLLLLFSGSVMSTSLRPHGWQHSRLPCPSLSPRVCSNSCPLSQWCNSTISSFVVPFSSCLQSTPALHIRWPKYWSFSFSISPFRLSEWSPFRMKTFRHIQRKTVMWSWRQRVERYSYSEGRPRAGETIRS